jgi:hypothetical protein
MARRGRGVPEERNEVRIAPGSERPASLGEVTERVIAPAVLDLVLTPAEEETAG